MRLALIARELGSKAFAIVGGDRVLGTERTDDVGVAVVNALPVVEGLRIDSEVGCLPAFVVVRVVGWRHVFPLAAVAVGASRVT